MNTLLKACCNVSQSAGPIRMTASGGAVGGAAVAGARLFRTRKASTRSTAIATQVLASARLTSRPLLQLRQQRRDDPGGQGFVVVWRVAGGDDQAGAVVG